MGGQTTPKPLDFHCALITGGAGGIGKALAQHFISLGKQVIIAGRTESKLQATAQEIGALAYYVFDQAELSSIPELVRRVTSDHPELDCLVNNAAVQAVLNFEKQDPATFLQMADDELDINVRGPMHLTVHLLPHLKTKSSPVIINITSALGFVPRAFPVPGYNATKAWLRSWTLNLRTSLAGAGVCVVEIAPPMVETDLHRSHDDPDNNKKRKNPMALSIDEFMHEVAAKLEKGDETIGAGTGAKMVEVWESGLGAIYKEAEEKYKKA